MAGTHGIHGMLGTIHGDVIEVGIRGAVVGIMETGIVSIHRKDLFLEQ
jgi:hypothetical protein